MKIGYLAERKLFLTDAAGKGGLVDSPFVQSVLDRAERDRSRHDWKSESPGWNLSSRGMMGMAGMPNGRADVRRIAFTSVAAAGPGQVLYFVDIDQVGGLFLRNLTEDHEQRLLHRQNLLRNRHLPARERRHVSRPRRCSSRARRAAASCRAIGSSIRRTPGGDETVVAQSVLAFDVDAAGSVIYTDGIRIFVRESGAAGAKEVTTARLIERVAFC